MPNYAYKALDTTGRSTEGSVGAVSRSSALDQLARQGLSPVWVQEQDAAAPVIRRQAPPADASRRRWRNRSCASFPIFWPAACRWAAR